MNRKMTVIISMLVGALSAFHSLDAAHRIVVEDIPGAPKSRNAVDWGTSDVVVDGFGITAVLRGEPANLGGHEAVLGVVGLGFDRSINSDGRNSEALVFSIPDETPNGKFIGLSAMMFGSVNTGGSNDVIIISGFSDDPQAFRAQQRGASPRILFDKNTGALVIDYRGIETIPVQRIGFRNPGAVKAGSNIVISQGLRSDGEEDSSSNAFGWRGLDYMAR